MKNIITIVLISCIFIILQCTLKDNPVVVVNSGTITVKVIDSSDSTVTDANIELNPNSGKLKQDSIGSYTFVEVKPGDYTVIANSNVFFPDSSKTRVFATDTSQVKFSLKHKPVLNVSIASLNFNQVIVGDTSSSMSYNIIGKYMKDSLIITAPDGFRISLDSRHYKSELRLPIKTDNTINETINVIFIPQEGVEYNSNIKNYSLYAEDVNVLCEGVGECSFFVNPETLPTFNTEGRSDTVEVSTHLNCFWTTTNEGHNWIIITPSAATGTKYVTIKVEKNTTNKSGRGGNINIAGQEINIHQNGGDCNQRTTFSNQLSFGSEGGDSVGSVQTDFEDCSWGSASGESWITITPSNGTGLNNNVTIKVDPDTTSHNRRSANIVIANQTIIISQEGDSCSFSVSKDSLIFSASDSTQSIFLYASFEDCIWNSSNNGNAWIAIDPEAEVGDQVIDIHVDENNSGDPRNAVISIAGNTIKITQNKP